MATCTVLEHLQVGAHIAKNALSYPRKLVAKNAGVNGSVVSEKILSSDNPRYGYNASTGNYEDLMTSRIINPTKMLPGARSLRGQDILDVWTAWWSRSRSPNPCLLGPRLTNARYGY
ncbi:hypothetical protein SAY86_001645 [Trapa natans]|uniref:Uncharacterized protein n=1 Tax=Trapa natans TaxID=22666 RepID=A0AAN7LQA3_TRANT|nr:hypothetical protein SAY86_001645 [Trapa natans]